MTKAKKPMADFHKDYGAKMNRREEKWAIFDQQATSDFLSGIKLASRLRSRVYEHATKRNRSAPRIKDFRDVFPNFPVYVTVDRRDNLRDNASLGQLFPLKRVLQQEFVQEFFKLQDVRAYEIAKRPLVVLIKWPGLNGTVAMHQIPYDSDIAGVSIRVVSNTDPVQRFAIEPVSQLHDLLKSYGVELT